MRTPLLAVALLSLVALSARADDDAVLTPERPLTGSFAEQAHRIGQHPKPTQPAKDSPADDFKFLGDMKELRALKRNGATTIWVDAGEGTAESPRHFYLTWTGTRGHQTPLLVFCQPSDGKHAEPPQDINLASRPLDWAEHMPIQVWQYPTQATTQRGLYAAVAADRGAAEPRLLQPIMWWGLGPGPDPDSVEPKDGPAAIKGWFGSAHPE